MPFRFNTLLDEFGIPPSEVRLLRHLPRIGSLLTLDAWRQNREAFEQYQSLQRTAARSNFGRPYWASFIGTWDGRTVFAGMYEVGEPAPLAKPQFVPLQGTSDPAGETDQYTTRRDIKFEPYEGRLYIDWGGGSSGKRAWTQRAELQNKLVIELHLDPAQAPFPGLLAINRPLSVLSAAPPAWIEHLSAAKGVYLLVCPRDGSRYVGSATAMGGFWSRWEEYRANGHGGNTALVGREPSDFHASILQVAGSADSLEDILAAEALWKEKLQTRTWGLDRN